MQRNEEDKKAAVQIVWHLEKSDEPGRPMTAIGAYTTGLFAGFCLTYLLTSKALSPTLPHDNDEIDIEAAGHPSAGNL